MVMNRIIYHIYHVSFFIFVTMAAEVLNVCTYNVHGINGTNWDYVENVVNNHDFVLLQEHWLHSSQAHIITDNRKDVNMSFVSGMDDSSFISGRPFGGCAIVWRNSMICRVEHVQCQSKRLCMVNIKLRNTNILLCTLYMPCDTTYDMDNINIYDNILREISSRATSLNIDNIICGGDFNTDTTRVKSLHTKSLLSFIQEEHFDLLINSPFYAIDHTFESKSNHVRSTIDHFMVSDNLVQSVVAMNCDHNVDNLSDHSVLSVSFDIHVYVDYISNMCNKSVDRPNWSRATDKDIENYKCMLDFKLGNVYVPIEALYCNDNFCTKHDECLQTYHDGIIDACISASRCISNKKSNIKCIPGWTEYVSPHRETAMFWHRLWCDNGRPRSGLISDIRRKTRAQYHNVLKNAKRNDMKVRSFMMAQNFLDSDRRDFWHELKKVRGGSVTCPTSIDGVQGEHNITNLFADKYQHLYNSVSYNSEHVSLLKRDIDDKIVHSHSECKSHLINAQDVINMVKELKLNKHDGNKGHYSNHITNGTHRLHCSISLLFNSMISHGFVPNDLLLSTIIPIPKNKRKSLSKSDNYRAIALSSIMGKLLDKNIVEQMS